MVWVGFALVVGTAVGMADEIAPCWAGGQNGQQNGQGEGDEIAKLREALRQPGSEGRRGREMAVNQLLSMKDAAAHDLLCESLSRGGDEDGLSLFILTALGSRFGNSFDGVFGTKNTDAAGRAALIGQYVGAILGPVEDWTKDGEGRLRVHARHCLLALSTADRVPAFETILQGDDAPLRVQAIAAAARCRDLNLAQLLADFIEHPVLAEHVRSALLGLTFRNFTSKQEFADWFEKNEWTYLDLLENANRSGQKALAAEQTARNRAQMELTLLLLDALVERDPVDWERVREQLLKTDPPGILGSGLARLRDLLAAKEKTSGVAADRLKLLADLSKRLENPSSATEHASLLEVSAYLVAPGETEQLALVHERLLAALGAKEGTHAEGLKLAALRGLSRFPSAEGSRAAVLGVLQAAHSARNLDTLKEALAVLHAKNWAAPAAGVPERNLWVPQLSRILFDTDLDRAYRQEALRVLNLGDDQKKRVPEVFDALLLLVRKDGQDSVLRMAALSQLAGFTVGDEERADQYVAELAQRLSDPDTGVRGRAAKLIDALPASGNAAKLETWQLQILNQVKPRLVVEPDENVLRELVASVKRLADKMGKPENAVVRVAIAVEEFAALPPEKRAEAFRREALVDGLTVLASKQGVQPMLWVRAGEALHRLGDRQNLRRILARHKPSALKAPAVDPEIVNRAMLLVLHTAALAGPLDWAKNAEEAGQALAAFDRLVAAKALPAEPALSALRIEIHAGRGEHGKLLEVIAGLSADGGETLSLPMARRVAFLKAQSLLALAKPSEAAVALPGAFANGQTPSAVHELQEAIVRSLIDKKDKKSYAQAVPLLESLVAKTPEDTALHLTRVLLLARAKFDADPVEGRADALKLLDAKRTLFDAKSVSEKAKQGYAALRARIEKGSKPADPGSKPADPGSKATPPVAKPPKSGG